VATAEKPVLWHLPVSHYSEKARWALAHKGVEHERRSPLPGGHMAVALWLTGGRHKTFPVVDFGDRRVGDSTAIIAELERRFPEPALYPEDPDERRRALELEDWFDEELGPHIRRYVFHELSRDSERMGGVASIQLPGPPALAGRVGKAYVGLRFGAWNRDRAAAARDTVRAALDRLDEELGENEYLVGEHFSVADLTAASLFYPLVLPPEGPRIPTDMPAALEDFRAPLRERRGWRWVEQTFRRHRRARPAPRAAAR
jgi:glutathione S-transferase